MRNLSLSTLASLVLMSLASPVSAQVDLIGDDDCFGLGVVCTEGALYSDLGGAFIDYRDPGDPLFTDNWMFGSVNWTHTISAVNIFSAILTFREAGMATVTPGEVFVNGFLAGTIPLVSNNFVTTHTFNLDPTWITGSSTVNISLSSGDGYIIDYSSLTVTRAVVPEPVSVLLVASGLLGVAFVGRRRRDWEA